MPLHDVGYRAWDGQKSSAATRWLAIAITGIQIALRSTWLSKTLILAWVPAIGFAITFFLYEQSIRQPTLRELGGNVLMMGGASPQIVQAAMSDPAQSRHDVWAALLMGYLRYPQAILTVILMAIVAPRLISFDLRNRGYLLYFSKPISVWEYILGKALVLWFFLAVVTTLPALVLYCVGLGLASDLGVFADTWDLPLRVLFASLALMLPTSAVALLCSSLTVESRYAAFAWFAIWVVGWVTFSVLSFGGFDQHMENADRRAEMSAALNYHSQWEVVSPYHLLGRVQQWVFGLYPADRSFLPSFTVVLVTTVGSLLLVHRQIRARLMA